MREPFRDYPEDMQELEKVLADDVKVLSVHLALLLTGDAPGVKSPRIPIVAIINAALEVYGNQPWLVSDIKRHCEALEIQARIYANRSI
jgi:hypothetical protein